METIKLCRNNCNTSTQTILFSFNNETTNKLVTFKSYMYIYLTVCKQMIDNE